MTGGLVERLEKADRGSRELDADLMEAFGFSTIRRRRHSKGVCWRMRGLGAWGYESHWCAIPNCTTSLDAALVLAERIRWRVRSMDASIEGRFSWCLQSLDPMPGVDEETGAIMSGIDFRYGSGKTPALALAAAILKASATSPAAVGES